MNSQSRRTALGSLSLASAITEFLAAERYYLRPSTIATYRSHLDAFAAAHEGVAVRDVRSAVVRAHVNQLLRSGKRYAARNRCIALRALSRYLAIELGLPQRDRPALADLRIPAVPRVGRAPYRPAEVLAIWDGIRRSPLRSRALWSAVFWLLLGTGIRSGEARTLLRRDVHLSAPRSSIGHVTVSGAHAKSVAAAREVPLDPRAEGAIRSYLLGRRLAWGDRDREPLFLSEDGIAFSADGWNQMLQRMRRAIATSGGPAYQPHRLRNTWARDVFEAGVPEIAIVQMAGWADANMLRRYVGELSVPTLKRYPTTLVKYAGRPPRLHKAPLE
ncbi:MAG: site-specific integrase [Candidatus Dormibacteraeota bacterium]|nr:site-specific integrase [Candidatus Dormibacteraeota bacterium]